MESKLRNCLRTKETYEKTKPFRLAILHGDREVMNTAQSVICGLVRDKSTDPISRFLAVQLAKDCIETFNDDFISQFQSTVLPMLEKQASVLTDSKDPDRGKYLYTDKPDQNPHLAQIGNSQLRLTLECLWVWSKWFPIDPETHLLSAYKVTFEKLIRLGVQFSPLVYFKVKTVTKHLPEVMVPIGMLKQLTKVLKKDLIQNKQQSSTKVLLQLLDCTLKQETNKIEIRDVFYSDIVYRALRKRQQAAKKSIPQGATNKSIARIQEDNKKINSMSQWQSVSQQSQTAGGKRLEESIEELKNSNVTLVSQLKRQEMIIAELQQEIQALKFNQQASEKKLQQTVILQQRVSHHQQGITDEPKFGQVQASKSALRQEETTNPSSKGSNRKFDALPVTPTKYTDPIQRSSGSLKAPNYEYLKNPIRMVESGLQYRINPQFRQDSSVNIVHQSNLQQLPLSSNSRTRF